MNDWIAVRDGKRPAGLADGTRFQFRGGYVDATASQEAPGHERLPVPAAPKCTCWEWLGADPNPEKRQHYVECALGLPNKDQRGTAARAFPATHPENATQVQPVPHLTRRERQAATQAEVVALRRELLRTNGTFCPNPKFGSRE